MFASFRHVPVVNVIFIIVVISFFPFEFENVIKFYIILETL